MLPYLLNTFSKLLNIGAQIYIKLYSFSSTRVQRILKELIDKKVSAEEYLKNPTELMKIKRERSRESKQHS